MKPSLKVTSVRRWNLRHLWMGWGAQEQQRKTVARELSEAREASQQWLDKAKP